MWSSARWPEAAEVASLDERSQTPIRLRALVRGPPSRAMAPSSYAGCIFDEPGDTPGRRYYSATMVPKRPLASSLNPAVKNKVFVLPAENPFPNAKPHRPLIAIALAFPLWS